MFAKSQSLPTYNTANAADTQVYNAMRKEMRFSSKTRFSTLAILQAVLLPWIVFIVVVFLQAFKLQYSGRSTLIVLNLLVLSVVLFQAWLGFQAWRRRHYDGVQESRLLMSVALLSFVSWIIGIAGGQHIYDTLSKPYYDASALNEYKGVNPSATSGQMFMDAGQITFLDGAHVDVSRSMGFRSTKTYCAAPIVGGNNASQTTYDFWAVGTDCCSARGSDFHCGQFANPKALSGLRLMTGTSGEQGFWRLAVQQAESAYNIHAGHPLFFTWVEDTFVELATIRNEAIRQFFYYVFTWFAWQIFATFICTMLIAPPSLF